MIIRPRPTLWDVLFTMKGSVAPRIAARLLVLTVWASLITATAGLVPYVFAKLSAAPFTLIGLSLSIFMSFRNNACYDRWWEGRKQLGQLLVEVRCLLRESQAFADDPARAPMLRAVCGFCHALKARLRDEDERAAAAPWMPPCFPTGAAPNVTDSALVEVGRHLLDLAARGVVSEWRYTLIEARLVSMSVVHTACERIRGAPLPFAYTLLLHRTAYLFCFLLPFGLAVPLGWGTPVITAIISYTFFGLDALSDELEDPFGRDVNDLPVDALVRTAEREIRAALGETDLPPALRPVNFVLQ